MSRPINISDTLTFIPNGYEDTGTYQFTQSTTTYPISNAYNNADNTGYQCQLTLASNRNNTRTSEIYFMFDTSAISNIPSGATINSVSGRVRYYVSSTSYVTAVSVRLYSGTSAKGTALTSRPTSSTLYNISAGNWTVSELEDLRLHISATHSASRTAAYFNLQGADVTVNYSLSGTEYEVSFSNTSEAVTSNPSTTQYVFQGGNQEIVFTGISSLDDVEITDNNSDIENLLTYQATRNFTNNLVPAALEDYSGYNITNQNNGCTGTDSTTYAQLGLRSQSSGAYMIYSFNVPEIPTNATNISVSCSVRAYISSTSTSITNKTAQLYSGTTAKGSAYTIPTTDSTFSLTTGSWTASELSNMKLRLGATYGNNSNYYLYFYGADLTISYTVAEDSYIYIISNISADHLISISDAAQISDYIKLAGEYKKIKKYYRKVNGSWVELSKEAFDQAVTSQVIMYGGSFGPSVYDEYGVVEKTASGTTITLDDTNLTSGNYTLKYEDSARNPISNVDDITTITVS